MTRMKGIAGIVYPDVFQVNQTINPMLNCLQSNSREKYGSHVFQNFEIGSCGIPMQSDEKKEIFCALYGFLDNREEIQKDLAKENILCGKCSDQELIVKAYSIWGKGCLIKLKGSFSIAILDQNQKRLIIARDSTGKKPLYWYHDKKHFLFSSQLKSLLTTGLIPQTPAPEALAAYFYFGYCPQDMTPIKGVSKLLPGYFLELKSDGSKVIQHYWSYSSHFEKRYAASPETIAIELDLLLKRAVEAHLAPNQTTGCFISGGIGSASVAYYLRRLSNPEMIKAFSVGFQGENEEDILAATDVAQELDIRQRRLMLSPKNFLNEYVSIAWHLDEPIADMNVLATWHLVKLAAEQTEIVYSGMGSDELFAGHSRYTTAERGSSLPSQFSNALLPALAHWFAPVLNLFYKPAAYSLLRHARASSWHVDYLKHNALFSESLMSAATPKLKGLFDPELFLNKFYHLPRIKTSTSAFLYFDVKTRMADMFITQYDKLTSAFGLKWYSPFLQRDVVEFAASLPEPDDLSEKQSAQYLKKILKNLIPDHVLSRPKKSRPHFLENWFEKTELPKLFQTLQHGTLVEEGYVSEEWLRHQLSSPEKMRKSMRQLWAILTLETWFRLFINQPIQDIPPEISLSEFLAED